MSVNPDLLIKLPGIFIEVIFFSAVEYEMLGDVSIFETEGNWCLLQCREP